MKRLAVGIAALALVASVVPVAEARGSAKPPAVFVVFDGFPGDTLLDAPGHIDSERYPSFAALARSSTWFPNAQGVFDSTSGAVPAILDGRLPRRGTEPTARHHPHYLFNLRACSLGCAARGCTARP